MKTSGRPKTKARLNKSVVILDPKTELAAATRIDRAIRRRITILDALGFFLPADAAATKHKKSRRGTLKNSSEKLEPKR